MKEAIIYLLAIVAAEAVTVFVQPVWGIVCHAIGIGCNAGYFFSFRHENLIDYGLTRALAHLLYANYCVPLSGKAKRVKRKCLCIVIAV